MPTAVCVPSGKTMPLAFTFPATSNFCVGLLVPMPTLPLASAVNIPVFQVPSIPVCTSITLSVPAIGCRLFSPFGLKPVINIPGAVGLVYTAYPTSVSPGNVPAVLPNPLNANPAPEYVEIRPTESVVTDGLKMVPNVLPLYPDHRKLKAGNKGLPNTSSLLLGVEVPMPTLPLSKMLE